MRHPDDGALLRHLDGQLLPGEARDVQQHLRVCVTCTARSKEIRRTLGTVADALLQTDAERRRPRARSIRWPAAAAAGIILALTVGVAPVRAWILSLPQTLWEAVVSSEGSAPTVSDTVAVVEPDQASLSFVPTTDVFVLQVASRQAEGSLTVQIVGGDSATATIVGNSNSEELVLLPGELRIINAPTSIAMYAVQLPAHLARIEIAVAGQPPVVLDRSAGRREWVISLVQR